MADLQAARNALAQRAQEVAGLNAQLADMAADLAAERARLAELKAQGDVEAIAASQARIEALAGQRSAAARAIGALHERTRVEIDAFLGRELALEGNTPLVLLPVRIETRSTADRSALRVRVYHDALHGEALDEGISPTERAAGIAYWRSVWADGERAAPWPALLAATSSLRASWVAEALRPINLAERPNGAPQFPPTRRRAERPITARTLPDRFFVRVEQDGAAPATFPGAMIPDELPVGLTSRDELTPLRIDGEDLPPIDESLRWLIDYTEAVRVGMALTVPLAIPGAPVRRLIVYGVRSALAPQEGAARLERMIRSHRFADGAGFVAQGTPTNNTEEARTDWSRRTRPGPPVAAPALEPDANAALTAAALGISADALASLPGSEDREQGRAAAFNTALWATTWGEAIEHLTPQGRANGDQRLSSPELDAVRDHWVAHVRGRGSLPVLRLGRQPYGLLPIVETGTAWRPLVNDFVENRLVPFIDQRIRWMWNDAQVNTPTVMNRPLDEALPLILGTDAVLRGLRVRTALSPDPVLTTAMALTLPDLGEVRSGQQVSQAVLLLCGVPDDALDSHNLLGTKTRALALPLAHETDQAFVASLLQSDPANIEPKSVLQVLLAHAEAVERHSRASVAAPEAHGLLREVVDASPQLDRELVIRAVDAAMEQRVGNELVGRAAEHVTAAAGRLDLRMVADREPIPAFALPTVAQQLAGAAPQIELLSGPVGLQLVGELLHRSQWGAIFRTALEAIGKIDSIEERRLLLAETLDCCSHRLDAWITAAASRRLHALRSQNGAGAFIGAYGWVEDIALAAPASAGQIDGREVFHDPRDGGYIHAPSLAHAATAGVLRSARLTHGRGDPNSAPLEIDLSSTRVRDALSLLEGVRNGQSLGALLGYRLERRLHELSGGGLELDRFVYVLRALAPTRAGKLTDPGAPAQESVAARDVVDGLRLLETPEATIRQKLEEGPADARYIHVWEPPSVTEANNVIDAIRELDRTHDAVADLLLAEAVHQLASGNPQRAAAAMDALGSGESPPPDPDVVRTPRSGVPIQHRLAVLIPDPLPERLTSWRSDTPRARAEPRLEAWARDALGEPSGILLAEGHPARLSYAPLSALDVLYDADGDSAGSSTLAARLRAAILDLPEDLSALAPVWELAGLLRAALAAGRPLAAADLGRVAGEGVVGRQPDAQELIARAQVALDALTGAARSPDPARYLVSFGVRPPPGQAAEAKALVAQALERAKTAKDLLDRAAGAAPASASELAAQALTAVFGTGFVALPLLKPPPAGETDPWAGAVGPGGVRARPGAEIRPWLARQGVVRTACAAFGEIILVREALGQRPRLRTAQTPAGAFASWVGLPFPDGEPPSVPLTSVVADVAGARPDEPEPALDAALAGVVLDEWTEVVPRRRRADLAAPDTPRDVQTTGLAVNANAPGARPPQAILIALSADGGDWTSDRLATLLEEAMALARMRMTTLQTLPFAGRQLPALYFRDWSLQGEPVIDWPVVMRSATMDAAQRYLSSGA